MADKPRRTGIKITYGYTEASTASIEDTLITPEKATQQKKTQKKTTTTKKSGASIDSLAPKLIIRPTKDMSFANK